MIAAMLIMTAFPLMGLLTVTAGADMSHMRTMHDFSPADQTVSWRTINDTVMGGVSASRFLVRDGVGTFTGDVSLENYGGFASVRSTPREYKLRGFDGIALRVRTDGKTYKFRARTSAAFDGVSYQVSFRADGDGWSTVKLPFSKFRPTWRGRVLTDRPPLDPAAIRALGFLISDKQEGSFRLDIDWIKASRD